jgi:hypothetical protein
MTEEQKRKRRDAQRKYRDANPERAREQVNRSRNRPGVRRKYWLKDAYGISVNDYEWLFILQGGRCATCQTSDFKPHVDHDHKTGKVRGLLCRTCNLALGYIEALDPAVIEALRRYAQDHKEKK